MDSEMKGLMMGQCPQNFCARIAPALSQTRVLCRHHFIVAQRSVVNNVKELASCLAWTDVVDSL